MIITVGNLSAEKFIRCLTLQWGPEYMRANLTLNLRPLDVSEAYSGALSWPSDSIQQCTSQIFLYIYLGKILTAHIFENTFDCEVIIDCSLSLLSNKGS